MSTVIRPEVSQDNKYWISKHRYYELKHFCMQYNLWKQMYNSTKLYPDTSIKYASTSKSNNVSDPVSAVIEQRLYFSNRIEMLERVAKVTDEVIGSYILEGVTSGKSYDILNAKKNIPCCKKTYYDLYRRFFWLLSVERQ